MLKKHQLLFFHPNFWVKLHTNSFHFRVMLTLSRFIKNICLMWLLFLFLIFLLFSCLKAGLIVYPVILKSFFWYKFKNNTLIPVVEVEI